MQKKSKTKSYLEEIILKSNEKVLRRTKNAFILPLLREKKQLFIQPNTQGTSGIITSCKKKYNRCNETHTRKKKIVKASY